MLDVLSLGMTPPGIYGQPLTFRFLLDTPFGFCTQDLTLDVPDLSLELGPLQRFASSIWTATYGSALSSQIHCSIVTVVNWKTTSPVLITVPIITVSGGVHIAAAERKDSGCVVFHTGHGDNYARRRLYLPGIPRNWVHEGLLNGTGQTALMNLMFKLYMAFKGGELPNPYRWMIAYPRVVASSVDNFFGVGFREPQFFRVCNHTGKPPEGAGLDWP